MGFLSDWFGITDAKKAINAAAEKSKGEQQAAYSDISGLYAPYRETGGHAFDTLGNLAGLGGPGAAENAMQMFQHSPGYDFRFNEGIRAIDNSGAARGNQFSGGTLKALNNYGQNQATSEYGNWINQLNNLSGMGYGATGQTAGARGNTANALTGIYTNQGEGNANAALAGGNLLMGGINTLGNLAGMAMGGMPTFGLGQSKGAASYAPQQGIFVTGPDGRPQIW